jgi:hypothetical protein
VSVRQAQEKIARDEKFKETAGSGIAIRVDDIPQD